MIKFMGLKNGSKERHMLLRRKEEEVILSLRAIIAEFIVLQSLLVERGKFPFILENLERDLFMFLMNFHWR
jgi:hypothetical protein